MRMLGTTLVLSAAVCLSFALTPAEKKRHLGLMRQTIDQVLKDYDPNSRPDPQDGSEHTSVVVHANMYIARAHFDHHDASLEVTYREEWEDDRLKFSPFVDHISFPAAKPIWRPDTYFATAQEIKKSAEMSFVRVEPEGFVSTSQRYTLKLDCRPASAAYPIVNRLVCLIKIGSYGATMDDIMYFWRRASAVESNSAPGAFQQFTLDEPVIDKCDAQVSTGSYSCIQVSLYFSAGVHEALFFFYLPCVLLLMCSWLHFWVHGSWTVPRTLSALAPFVLFVAALLFLRHPATETVTAWDVWIVFCSVLSFLSLLEYFICIYLGVRRAQPASSEQEKPLLSGQEEGSSAAKAKCSGRGGATGLDYASRLFFPLITAIFFILYMCLFLLL